MTFLDGDGSVQAAAVVRPPASAAQTPFRVLIAPRHGVRGRRRTATNSSRGSSDDDYTGVPGACAYGTFEAGATWRASARAQGPRRATAWRGAGPPQIVVAGHSMGGHGAGLLAAALGSGAKGVAINAGWPRKEVYGDSNTRYLHDQGAHLIEPALRGVLDATLAGSAVDAVASNLCCMRGLLRVGAVDEACHHVTCAVSRVCWRDVRRSTRRSRRRPLVVGHGGGERRRRGERRAPAKVLCGGVLFAR